MSSAPWGLGPGEAVGLTQSASSPSGHRGERGNRAGGQALEVSQAEVTIPRGPGQGRVPQDREAGLITGPPPGAAVKVKVIAS